MTRSRRGRDEAGETDSEADEQRKDGEEEGGKSDVQDEPGSQPETAHAEPAGQSEDMPSHEQAEEQARGTEPRSADMAQEPASQDTVEPHEQAIAAEVAAAEAGGKVEAGIGEDDLGHQLKTALALLVRAREILVPMARDAGHDFTGPHYRRLVHNLLVEIENHLSAAVGLAQFNADRGPDDAS
jgi:cobalamin biosynthesis protein CobT